VAVAVAVAVAVPVVTSVLVAKAVIVGSYTVLEGNSTAIAPSILTSWLKEGRSLAFCCQHAIGTASNHSGSHAAGQPRRCPPSSLPISAMFPMSPYL
jgi:hypothetical protein